MSPTKIVVLSCGVSFNDLTDSAKKIALSANVLIGGTRLLGFFPDFKGEKIPLKSNVRATVHAAVKKYKGKKIVFLASGDALFFGIGKTLREEFSKERIEFIPNVSAMQTACARMGISWEQAEFFSAHGKNKALPWRRILQAPLAVMYADDKRPANILARELISNYPGCKTRPAAIAENLGLANERVKSGTLSKLAAKKCGGLSLLMLLKTDEVSDAGLSLGLSDDEFQHQAGLITHAEIRAVALSKLKLGPGVLWDLGAGSGSVGIEASLLCRELKVFAVEKSMERCRDIAHNGSKFGCQKIEVIAGNALEQIKKLPRPRAIYAGGGGEQIAEIVRAAYARLLPGGRMVVPAVTLETSAELSRTLSAKCMEAITIAISRAKNLAGRRLLRAENPITLFVYEKNSREKK